MGHTHSCGAALFTVFFGVLSLHSRSSPSGCPVRSFGLPCFSVRCMDGASMSNRNTTICAVHTSRSILFSVERRFLSLFANAESGCSMLANASQTASMTSRKSCTKGSSSLGAETSPGSSAAGGLSTGSSRSSCPLAYSEPCRTRRRRIRGGSGSWSSALESRTAPGTYSSAEPKQEARRYQQIAQSEGVSQTGGVGLGWDDRPLVRGDRNRHTRGAGGRPFHCKPCCVGCPLRQPQRPFLVREWVVKQLGRVTHTLPRGFHVTVTARLLDTVLYVDEVLLDHIIDRPVVFVDF